METQVLYKMVQENFPSILRKDNLETYGTSDKVKESFNDLVGKKSYETMMKKLAKEWNVPLESLHMTVNNANDGSWTCEFQLLAGILLGWDLNWHMEEDQKHYTNFEGLENDPKLSFFIDYLEQSNQDKLSCDFFPTKPYPDGQKQEWQVFYFNNFKVAQVFYTVDDWSDVYMVYSII